MRGLETSKTLADMTAEERAECVGMWCEVAGQLEILAEPDGMVDYHDTVIMHSVKRNGGGYVLAKNVTPRFDLLRAWPPDGEPELAQALAEETWEYSYQELRGDEWETAFNDVTHLEEWWPKKSDVDWIVEEARKHGYVCRLVRRRVSPVVIVNE